MITLNTTLFIHAVMVSARDEHPKTWMCVYARETMGNHHMRIDLNKAISIYNSTFSFLTFLFTSNLVRNAAHNLLYSFYCSPLTLVQ